MTPTKGSDKGSFIAGKYKIIEKLGEGGMGVVYKAEDTRLKRTVALKFLPPDLTGDPEAKERFLREAQAAAALSHPNICTIHEIDEEEGKAFIAMEYIEGQSIYERIKKGPLKLDEALNIALQAAQGLGEAHKRGVIHRDIKSANIMVTEAGQVKIMDFGLAKVTGAALITKEAKTMGTVAYMSPEQARGEAVDARTDIWSAGVVLYEMLTGHLPFGSGHESAVLHAIGHEEPIPILKSAPHIPPEVEHILNKALEKDREKRYQTAAALISDLRNIEEGLPLVARTRPRHVNLIGALFRNKLFVPSLFVFLLVAALVIWQVISRKTRVLSPAPVKPSLAVMYFENNTGDESLDYWGKMLSDSLITDLSQSKYMRILSGDRLYKILGNLGQSDAKTYSADVLNEVAKQGRVGYILQGKYARMGNVFRIDVTIQEAGKGEIIGSERVEAKGEDEVFPQIDELTRRIKTRLNLSVTEIASDIDSEAGQITTPFPEAYRYYLEGRDFHNKGDYPNAVQYYEKALAIDPDFAMVYIALAEVYQQPTYYFARNREYAQKALELSGRLSEREQLIVQGTFYTTSEETWDKAIEAYNKLLELYPDDMSGNKNLGELYYHLERWDEAIERFLVCKENNDESYSTYVQAADAYAANGLYDKAEEILEYCLTNFSDNAQIHVALIHTCLHRGKYDLALLEVDKAFPSDKDEGNNSFWKGYVYFLKGDLSTAEKEYLRLLAKGENREIRKLLNGIYLTQGKFSESINQLEKALESSKTALQRSFHLLGLTLTYLRSGKAEEALMECEEGWAKAVEADNTRLQRYALHIKGLVYLAVKSTDRALEAAHELKEMIERGIKRKEIRMYYDLMGMIELEKNNPSGAIEYLKKAIILLPSQSMAEGVIPLFLDHLATAYYEAGDIDRSRKEYENITSLTTSRYLYGDIYAKSFYMLGKIHEKQGNTTKAVGNYQKFLDLWKDADPGMPEVEDANKRLDGLKGQ